MNTKPTMPLLVNPIKGQVCWSCEHLYYSKADAGYSEYTPGYDFSLSCNKGYWTFENYSDELTDFRNKLTNAELCADFKLHNTIK